MALLSLAVLAASLCSALAFDGAATCDAVNSFDTDFNGGDLPNQPASSSLSTPAECAALCCANSQCIAFSLNAGAPGARECYLKSSISAPGASPGCDSGCIVASGLCSPAPGVILPWFNFSLTRAERLSALVDAMTLNESIASLNDAAPAIPRLGLPAYSWEAEALHGVSWNGVATVFPQNIAWGATFDVDLVAQIADVIATEARAKFIDGMGSDGSTVEFAGLSFMTPNNNLFVDPTWGRGQECYGEDPFLTSAITYSLVRGLQEGADPSYRRIIATSKHWLAYVRLLARAYARAPHSEYARHVIPSSSPLSFHSTSSLGLVMANIVFHTLSTSRRRTFSRRGFRPSPRPFART